MRHAEDVARRAAALAAQLRAEDRTRCGRLGEGRPGRKFRRSVLGVGVKARARTTDEGRAWLQRKRAS